MLEASAPFHAQNSYIFSRELYNSLGSVESAFDRISKDQRFDEFLRRLGLLFDIYGCGRNFGAFLLHRHYTPEPGEIPLEMPLFWGESSQLSLVTQMLDSRSVSAYAPSRWRYNREKCLFEALEYSTDPYVIEQWKQLLASPLLLSDIAQLLQEFDLLDSIGFTIAKRSSLPKQKEATYLEISDAEARASVVTLECKSVPAESRSIPTVWIPTVACWCASDTLCWEIGCMTMGSKHIGDPDGDVHHTVESHKTVPCV